ncbi:MULTISPECIES: hypothetical protein [unclassified Rhizobium]|uniref:hypothetical protein n=1 Tax=unclassified Rhizobium TaxID=2613769 RepID=UPI0028895801|nr:MULTISPECIES: hypothetical protein [unclassified Rhizobium]
MAETAVPMTSQPGKASPEPAPSFWVRLYCRMMHKLVITTLAITDDLLIHLDSASDYVEFGPMLDG